jgi:Fic family protein
VIRRSRDQYNNSFLWTEQDDNDLTYFMSYHLKQIHNSIHEFKKYMDEKEREHEEVETQLHLGTEYNARQKLVLGHLIAEGEKGYVTVQSHSMSNGVSWLTAQKDLKKLVESGYLKTQKIGRYVRYMPTEKLLIVH